MSLRTVRLLEALNAAAFTYQGFDQEEARVGVPAITDMITAMYELDTAARDIVSDVITGKVTAVKAIRALKAIAAMYEEA